MWPVQLSSTEQSEAFISSLWTPAPVAALQASPPHGMALILIHHLKASVNKTAKSFIRLMSSPVSPILPAWEDLGLGAHL